ncbi:hypothetical protein ACWGQ5_35860 [Streptomyces sp. NPDC055722]
MIVRIEGYVLLTCGLALRLLRAACGAGVRAGPVTVRYRGSA